MRLFLYIALIGALTYAIGVAVSWMMWRRPMFRRQARLCTEKQLRRRTLIGGVNISLMLLLALPSFLLLDGVFVWEWRSPLQLLILFVVDDLLFYIGHRAQHQWPWLYRIHAQHHQAFAPLPIDFLYVHPVDLAMGSTWVSAAVATTYLATGPVSAYALLTFVVARNVHQLWIHSGLRLPLVAAHDQHHEKSGGNYGSVFPVWDALFGTAIKH